jgi:hypothetical protein
MKMFYETDGSGELEPLGRSSDAGETFPLWGLFPLTNFAAQGYSLGNQFGFELGRWAWERNDRKLNLRHTSYGPCVSRSSQTRLDCGGFQWSFPAGRS